MRRAERGVERGVHTGRKRGAQGSAEARGRGKEAAGRWHLDCLLHQRILRAPSRLLRLGHGIVCADLGQPDARAKAPHIAHRLLKVGADTQLHPVERERERNVPLLHVPSRRPGHGPANLLACGEQVEHVWQHDSGIVVGRRMRWHVAQHSAHGEGAEIVPRKVFSGRRRRLRALCSCTDRVRIVSSALPV